MHQLNYKILLDELPFLRYAWTICSPFLVPYIRSTVLMNVTFTFLDSETLETPVLGALKIQNIFNDMNYPAEKYQFGMLSMSMV